MSFGSDKSGSSAEAAQARADEQARQERVRSGTANINGIFDKQFTPDYFTGRKQAYIDYATPQLNDQHGKASKELTFSLARSGLLDSSARAQKEAELKKEYDLNQQQIADQALATQGQAKSAVEDARSGLITTLNATGDAAQAANSANARSAALSQPAAFSPISNLFADFTNGLGTQAALEKANYYSGGQIAPRYQTGIFAPKTNSVAVK